MTTMFRGLERPVAVRTTAAALTLGVVIVALMLSSPASAQSGPACSDDVTGAPTGPATGSVTRAMSYGRVLGVGSRHHVGCSLYLLTSDQLHALTGGPFGCSDNANALKMPCDSALWPALLTRGAP